MAEKKKGKWLPSGFSPCGSVKFIYLDKPQLPFEGKGDPHYKVTIVLDPKQEKTEKWIKELDALTELKGRPWKNDEDDPYMINVTFKSLRQVSAYDSVGNQLPEGQWPAKGSVVRIAYGPSVYSVGTGGLTLYLQGVQVIEMVEKLKFPVEEGAYVSDGISKSPAADGSAQGDGSPF